MSKTTISDFIAKDNKDKPFEERAKKFEDLIEPICKEWGVIPSAVLLNTNQAIMAVPNMKDLWDSSKE